MNNDFNFILTSNTLTAQLDDGREFTWQKSHADYEKVVGMLKKGTTSADLSKVMDVAERITHAAAGYDDITIVGDAVYYQGAVVENTLCRRIIDMTAQGFDVGPMVAFLRNLMDNPRSSSVRELYGFLEKSNMPITPDGHFIAYKIVRADYRDVYTGTMDNSPGQTVAMPANKVDDDRNRTCSSGLHVCAKGYLPHYGSGSRDRIVICKINPAHVVSVPVDYNDAKMRVHQYVVIGELNDKDKAGVFETRAVFKTADHSGYASWHEDDGYGPSADLDDDSDLPENEEEEEDNAADGDAQANLFVRDSYDSTMYYPATVQDIRDGDTLYVYDTVEHDYKKVK